MRGLLLILGLAIAAPALAEGNDAPLTASVASKASYVRVSGGGASLPVDRVIPGQEGGVAGIRVIYAERFVTLPGATISAVNRNTLQTTLTRKELDKLP